MTIKLTTKQIEVLNKLRESGTKNFTRNDYIKLRSIKFQANYIVLNHFEAINLLRELEQIKEEKK